MQNSISIFFVALLAFASCNGQTNDIKSQPNSFGTSKHFTKEIPINKDGRNKGDTDYMFQYIRQDASELGLSPIENGFDNLQIRVWLGHSMAIKRNVVILKNISGQWSGQLVTYSHEHDEKNGKDSIDKKNIKEIQPASGWDTFRKKLNEFKILTLPNAEDLKGYNGCGMDGIAYYFETSTNKKYRCFYYCNPDENVDKFWEAKNVLGFASLLETEFDFKYTK